MDMQGVPEACSWISLGMTGARVASPTEGSIAVLISVRNETACHGLGAELLQLPFGCIAWSHCQETGTSSGQTVVFGRSNNIYR